MIVVLFSTVPRDDLDLADYQRASARMRELVATVPGFISYNTYQAEGGETLAIARFASVEALNACHFHPVHREIQDKARHSYYQRYWVQVCATVREYRFHGNGCEHDLRGLFAAGSAIRPAP